MALRSTGPITRTIVPDLDKEGEFRPPPTEEQVQRYLKEQYGRGRNKPLTEPLAEGSQLLSTAATEQPATAPAQHEAPQATQGVDGPGEGRI